MKHKIVIFSVLLLSLQVFAENKADNTKINERDRAADQQTADQQTYSKNDMIIIRRIRQEIMKEKDLSTYAQNVKIISVDGVVTLKGPVRSAHEQSRILKYARSVAGVTNVTDEMAIVPAKE